MCQMQHVHDDGCALISSISSCKQKTTVSTGVAPKAGRTGVGRLLRCCVLVLSMVPLRPEDDEDVVSWELERLLECRVCEGTTLTSIGSVLPECKVV